MPNDPPPSFLRPPPERGVPLGAWLTGLVLLGVLALQLLRLTAATAPEPASAAAPAPTAPPAPAARPAPVPAAPALPPARVSPAVPGDTVVTRCVQAGRTTFTDGDCAPSAQASELRVQRDLNLADGAAHLPRARPQRAPQAAAAPGGNAARAGIDRRSECAALARHIDRLDAQARQPQSGQMQDWISERRHQARSRQFQLRC